MPIFKSQVGGERGAAGETGFSQSKRYNFGNLYAQNRLANNSLDKKASDLGDSAAEAEHGAQRAFGDKARGSLEASGNEMSNAVARAKDISNQSEGFSVEEAALKQGQTPYQAGISGFYAGSSNPAIEKIRSYSNTYGNMLAQQRALSQAGAGQRAAGAQPPQYVAPTTMAGTRQGNYDAANSAHMAVGISGENRTQQIDDLTWGLQQGKISADEYYAAQRAGPGSPEWTAAMKKING